MPPRWKKPHRNGSRQEKTRVFSMKRSRIILTVGLCALLSCASFLRKVDAARIKHHEKRDYVLTQDVTQGEMTLKKGERVKLYIITGDDNIKVYCYSAQSEFLKANRVLILYLFEDDFTGNRFDVKTFEDRLFVLVSVWSK